MRINPMIRKLILAAAVLSAIGCSRGEPVSEQAPDDPSARTTTAYNAQETPAEIAAKCDVPLYPGASAPQGMSHMPKQDTDGIHYELVLATKDSPRKVATFYATTLKLDSKVHGDNASLMGLTPKKNAVIIVAAPEAGQTIIRIKSIASPH